MHISSIVYHSQFKGNQLEKLVQWWQRILSSPSLLSRQIPRLSLFKPTFTRISYPGPFLSLKRSFFNIRPIKSFSGFVSQFDWILLTPGLAIRRTSNKYANFPGSPERAACGFREGQPRPPCNTILGSALPKETNRNASKLPLNLFIAGCLIYVMVMPMWMTFVGNERIQYYMEREAALKSGMAEIRT